MKRINFPGIGEADAILYHQAESVSYIIQSHFPKERLDGAMQRIKEEKQLTLKFHHDATIKINGVKYCRLYITVMKYMVAQSYIYSIWFRGSKVKGGKVDYSENITDAAQKILKKKYELPLREMYDSIITEMRQLTVDEFLQSLEMEIQKQEALFDEVRMSVRQLKGETV